MHYNLIVFSERKKKFDFKQTEVPPSSMMLGTSWNQ